MPLIIPGIIISYLIGSLPTAYLFGRLFKRIDIREHGSGNMGATNALRVLGRGAGITVLLIDILKGALPVIFIGDYLAARDPGLSPEVIRIIIGISCICGHNWTVFLKFKGGKGVATTLGVLIGLSLGIPVFAKSLILIILLWLIVFLFSRIVSLASLIAALAFVPLLVIFRSSMVLIVFGLLISVFIVVRHKKNISRILQGKESRITFRKSQS
ncbi:MAG: glycerol-3-phosphate 1-O-acyltransferase PlsY [Candidatus Omnitrophica bacterium]|jgi:glycerol-3-phosphate acyltransferase PlsY|nr:glycerol-3-phosphate 1-O-acyltransferase PlsY [Candidatus Omnitrophota bacterium]MDD5512458.1 glycerol-3-phosphate 1-O-acyltransferase PlsY [Candidatus Omnitrophota bacterium]